MDSQYDPEKFVETGFALSEDISGKSLVRSHFGNFVQEIRAGRVIKILKRYSE